MTDPSLLAELTGMLVEVTGEDDRWARRVAPDSRLEDDLRLDSVEFAALGESLRDRYGDRVDLAAFLAGLELEEIIALTVDDLGAFVAARTAEVPAT